MPHWELNPVLVHRYNELDEETQGKAFSAWSDREWEMASDMLSFSIENTIDELQRVPTLRMVQAGGWSCDYPGTANVRLAGYAFWSPGDDKREGDDYPAVTEWLAEFAKLSAKHPNSITIARHSALLVSCTCCDGIDQNDVTTGQRLWRQLEGIVEDLLEAESLYIVSIERFEDWLTIPENNRFTKEGQPC